MALIKCPECNLNLSDTVTKCIHCGAELTKCPECGATLTEKDIFCSNCGYRIKELEKNTPDTTVENNTPQEAKATALSDDKNTLMDLLASYAKKNDKRARTINTLCAIIICLLELGIVFGYIFLSISFEMDMNVILFSFAFILPLIAYVGISNIIKHVNIYNKANSWNYDLDLTVEDIRSRISKDSKTDDPKKATSEIALKKALSETPVMESTWFILQHKYDTTASVIFDIVKYTVTLITVVIGLIVASPTIQYFVKLLNDFNSFNIQDAIMPVLCFFICIIICGIPDSIFKKIEKSRRYKLLEKLENEKRENISSNTAQKFWGNSKGVNVGDRHLLNVLSQRINTNAIIWLVIGIIQTLSIFFAIVGILNIISAVRSLKYSKAILINPTGIVQNYVPVFGSVIVLLYNIFFGGIIGVIGSIYYLIFIRGFVMENRDYFNSLGG